MPNAKAIASAESLLRQLRTGELTGFVAVATDTDDVSSFMLGGKINLTQTICLLEDMKLRCLEIWMQRFKGRRPSLAVVEVDEE